MNLPPKSVDYPFLITIGGIGALMSLAGLISGVALGSSTLGYIMAVTSLVISAIMIGRSLFAAREASPAHADPVAVTRMVQPLAITSLDGNLVYCNMPYRLFLKECVKSETISPLELMEAEQAKILKQVLFSLDKGSEESRTVQLISGKNQRKYAEVTLSRKTGQEDYINWKFSGSTSEVPVENRRHNDNGFTLEQLGNFLDCSDCGLIAVSEAGEITYANDLLLHWMTGRSVKDLQLPLPLADFSLMFQNN